VIVVFKLYLITSSIGVLSITTSTGAQEPIKATICDKSEINLKLS